MQTCSNDKCAPLFRISLLFFLQADHATGSGKPSSDDNGKEAPRLLVAPRRVQQSKASPRYNPHPGGEEGERGCGAKGRSMIGVEEIHTQRSISYFFVFAHDVLSVQEGEIGTQTVQGLAN